MEVHVEGETDPFRHHPELRDRIADPAEATFYRTFNAEAFFAGKPEFEAFLEALNSDEQRDAIRADTLARHEGGDLWVFGYGSLMWNPAFHFTEVRRATLDGYARRFAVVDRLGGRGTPEAPGLMAALDRGAGCEGLVFRIAEDMIAAETEILWRRECIVPGYIPTFVTAHANGTPIRALTFLADHDADDIEPDLSFDEQVHLIATGEGFLGSSRDYLVNIVGHFEAMGIRDDGCAALLGAVDRYLAAGTDTGDRSP